MNWFRTPRNDTENCFGTDVDKNFNYKWMKRGASDDECSEFYGGPRAFSEPEVKLVSDFLMDKKKNIQMFIALNGYGQKISFPSEGISPRKLDEVRDVARAGAKSFAASKLNLIKYMIESSRKKPGSMDNFAMRRANIKLSYTIEAKDDQTYGFFVPAISIEENAKEFFEIIKGMASNLIE